METSGGLFLVGLATVTSLFLIRFPGSVYFCSLMLVLDLCSSLLFLVFLAYLLFNCCLFMFSLLVLFFVFIYRLCYLLNVLFAVVFKFCLVGDAAIMFAVYLVFYIISWLYFNFTDCSYLICYS